MAPIMRVPVAAYHFLDMFLAGVAAPALDVSATSENPPIDFGQIVFVQPGFTGALDIVAVIEHETGADSSARNIRNPVTFS